MILEENGSLSLDKSSCVEQHSSETNEDPYGKEHASYEEVGWLLIEDIYQMIVSY